MPVGPPGLQDLGGNVKTPADFGLDIADWQDLDVFALEIVVLKEDGNSYLPVPRRANSNHAWYFEAKEVLPFTSALLAQIASVKSSTLLKRQAAEAGFEIPSRETWDFP
ncbi:MAG: hypothetical protein ACOH5I_10865 [Oligoflexus sp.]